MPMTRINAAIVITYRIAAMHKARAAAPPVDPLRMLQNSAFRAIRPERTRTVFRPYETRFPHRHAEHDPIELLTRSIAAQARLAGHSARAARAHGVIAGQRRCYPVVACNVASRLTPQLTPQWRPRLCSERVSCRR